jgi:hypothetical protein
MFTSPCRWILLVLLLSASACGDDGEFRFGENLSGLQYEFYDVKEGVHPSTVVLENRRNPFRNAAIGTDTKWEILSSGGNAGAFYAWATLLARAPTGEHQYYTATKLRDIYNAREVEGPQLDLVRQMAIAGFQAVLDEFPDSVTFDSTGTQTFRLATPALMGILDLNGDVNGDWVLVVDQNGDLVAVKGAGVDGPPPGGE